MCTGIIKMLTMFPQMSTHKTLACSGPSCENFASFDSKFCLFLGFACLLQWIASMYSESTFLNITKEKNGRDEFVNHDKQHGEGRAWKTVLCVYMHEHFVQLINITAKLHVVFLCSSLLIISSSVLSAEFLETRCLHKQQMTDGVMYLG